MKRTQDFPQRLGSIIRSRRFVLVAFVLIFGGIAAYGSGSKLPNPWNNSSSAASLSKPISQDKLPGTEEFGLTKRELVEKIEAVEALIAKCMSGHGFEYIAVDYKTVYRGMKADKSLPGLSEEEYIARYGFGISTMYTGKPPQLASTTTPAKIGLGEQNVRIFSNLSAADQVAYTHTLFGKNPDASFSVGVEIENFSWTGGCTREAIEQVFTPEQLKTNYVNPMNAYIDQDPRMLKAYQEYSDCMAEEGFKYKRPGDVEDGLRERLYTITGGLPIDKLSPEARAALEALQAEERAVADVAFDCEEDIIEPVEQQIEKEMYGRPPK